MLHITCAREGKLFSISNSQLTSIHQLQVRRNNHFSQAAPKCLHFLVYFLFTKVLILFEFATLVYVDVHNQLVFRHS